MCEIKKQYNTIIHNSKKTIRKETKNRSHSKTLDGSNIGTNQWHQSTRDYTCAWLHACVGGYMAIKTKFWEKRKELELFTITMYAMYTFV